MFTASITLEKPNNFEEATKMPDLRFEPAEPFSLATISEIVKRTWLKITQSYCEFVNRVRRAFVGGLIDGATDLPILTFFSADEDEVI